MARVQKKQASARYYDLSSILGNDWAMFYCIIGGRKTGKSYSVTDFLLKQHKKYKDQVKNYWMRISETSVQMLLNNKASKLVDPDLARIHNCEITRKNNVVYNHGETFCEVYPLSQFGKLKGVGFYDKDFNGWYNIVLDEFQLEQGERRTSFDILYNFIGMLENLVRTTKTKVRVFLLGNTLEEASTILKAFNFLPQAFGRFKLKSKRCVIDNIEPTEEYLADRKGSIADILGGDSMSNYTNALIKDLSLIDTSRKKTPTALIKFGKQQNQWYIVWDGRIVSRYKRQPIKRELIVAMRPYLNEMYMPERVKQIIEMYDSHAYLKFDTLITQSYFTDDMTRIRSSK